MLQKNLFKIWQAAEPLVQNLTLWVFSVKKSYNFNFLLKMRNCSKNHGRILHFVTSQNSNESNFGGKKCFRLWLFGWLVFSNSDLLKWFQKKSDVVIEKLRKLKQNLTSCRFHTKADSLNFFSCKTDRFLTLFLKREILFKKKYRQSRAFEKEKKLSNLTFLLSKVSQILIFWKFLFKVWFFRQFKIQNKKTL